MSAIAFNRAIGPVAIDVVITERHESTLEIATNPIEAGADIADHAYMAPRVLVLDIADESAALTWQALRRLQESRVPFTVVSGLDVYTNLLIRNMSAERSADYGNILRNRIELQEVILVDTGQAAASDGGGSQKSERGGKAAPGSKGSRRSAVPASSRASGQATQDRAAQTVQRGDSVTKPVDAQRGSSLLFQIFGGT
ncbi:hypothetical protein D3218_13110 [Aureimonas flava]|uniref:Dit-like phage tail protein N-terminal domain-containing protein n=1 Tax=Aureimonas flava TaxID=2320271 RepID=A0A3A1WR17_9HYPH|nr:hypothetical protein [Aureimonas flava]RIY00218.1 hypothetical protein D3218_13110 [Aureimonas flava]